jgi:cadmium resistance protein CadD (predicted permease)
MKEIGSFIVKDYRQFMGISALFFASFILALTALLIPAAYLGLLGLAPIAIGLSKLRDLLRGKEETEEELERHEGVGINTNVLAVAAVTVANGGDNISTYVPIFATHSIKAVFLIGVVFLILTAVWCLVSHYMVHHPKIRGPIQRYGHWIVPFVLIGLGVMILHDARTLNLIAM